jgi:diguanylate cyclase (GGDEF)-like protein/PAS domain S-box-containing protein
VKEEAGMSGEVRNIRLKLLIAFLLPALGLLYFSAGLVYDKFNLYQNSRYLERVTDYVARAAHLTQELQKERGLSMGRLSGRNCAFFREALAKQRPRTDAAFNALNRFLWHQEGWEGERQVKRFLQLYARLPEVRRAVDARSKPMLEIFDYYSDVIDQLIRTTRTLGDYFISRAFTRTIKNFEDLLSLIEVSGKERALVSALLESHGAHKAELESRLLALEKRYEILKKDFEQEATIHTLQIYHRILDRELAKRYERVRRAIVYQHRYDRIESREWWTLATQYINRLYQVDFALLDYLDTLKEKQKNDAIRTLWISVLIWIVFVGFLLFLIRYIFRVLERFGKAIEHSDEETRFYKAFAEFSEYLVFHRDESILLNSLATLLYQTEHFRYAWIGRFEGASVLPVSTENLSAASIEQELTQQDSLHERLHRALEQVQREMHPLHLRLPDSSHSVLLHEVGEIGLFPITRQRECCCVLVLALPPRHHFETQLIDLIQKMCNSLGSALERIEVEAQERKMEEELRIAATAFNAHEAITITDAEGTILQVNDAFTQITGYPAEEAIGNNPNILKSGKHDKAFYVEMWDHIRKEGFWKGEIYNRRKNGEIYPEMLSISAVRDGEGKITHYVAHFFDISEIKSAQQDAEYRAQHDPLTDLYNRQKLTESLENIYRQSLHSREYNAFLYLDLDNFKHINDYYNHEMGDKVLMEVARRLRRVVHADDILARIAGDEFALILCCLGTDRQMATKKATIVVEKIRNLFKEPLEIDGVAFEIAFSIGIKLFPDAEREWKEVMINADVAMYHAKKSGKNQYNFFNETLDMDSKRFLRLKNEFTRALKQGELLLHYQPRVDIATGRIVGMEALVRWEHPERGLIYPDEFLYVSQGNTLGYELNEYVLEAVCRQVAVWRDRYPRFDLRVSVNISGEQFNSQTYIEHTLNYLRERPDITPYLEFEIVEDALLKDLDHTIRVIREFQHLHIGFCMDDFGTGYSSIEYLKRLPVDVVKIDRSFVMDLFHDRNDEVVKLIIKTAEIFGLETVAEGVETPEALEFLRSVGCTAYQGYLFSPPVGAEEIEALFRQQESHAEA